MRNLKHKTAVHRLSTIHGTSYHSHGHAYEWHHAPNMELLQLILSALAVATAGQETVSRAF